MFFGYPSKIEELAQKYGKTQEEIDFIITKYGTIENFFQSYRTKGLKDEENIILARSILIDIDGNNNEGYDKLIKALINMFEESRNDTDSNMILYSSKTLQEALQELTENERYIIERRYDLTGKGKYPFITKIGEEMGVSSQRISQLKGKAERKLIKINRKNSFICNIEELKNSQLLTDEEKAKFSEIEDLLSKLQILNVDIASEKLEEIFEFIKNIRKKIKDREKETIQNRKADIKISDLELSTMTYHALARCGIDTLDDLSHMTYQDLNYVRHLGEKGRAEIVSMLKEYGINLECEDDSNKQKARGRAGIEISDLKLSTMPYNALARCGIFTLEDLSHMTYEDLEKVRHLGKKGRAEVISKLEEHGLHLRRDNINEREEMQSIKQCRKADIKISDLRLNTRIYRALARCGIDTLEDLSHMTYEDLERIPNLGKKGITKIVSILEEYGINLECEDDPNKEKARRKAIEYGAIKIRTRTSKEIAEASISSLTDIEMSDREDAALKELVEKTKEGGMNLYGKS